MEFDLFQNRDCGQLWLDDRKMLWDAIRTLKPALAVETGTWRGGGSTFFIASALKMNGSGVLYTVENDPAIYTDAVNSYATQWAHLLPYVRLNLGDSEIVYKAVLPAEPIDFIFLDGSQDEKKTRQEFELLVPRLRKGGILMAHDWFNGKAEAIKPLLSDASEWYVTTIGTGVGSFESGSVGMARALKLK